MPRRGRPGKYRIVRIDPKISQFSPRGRPGRPEEVDIGMDAYEALRLADYQGLSQKEAAKSMRISQQTFSRVLRKARFLMAKGITTGSAIRIQGGQYVISSKIQEKPKEIPAQIPVSPQKPAQTIQPINQNKNQKPA